MSDFRKAVEKTLVHEGGYTDNPHDKGGPTKYGITQEDMPGVDIASITPEQAVAYYQEHYWKPLYSQIADQALGEKLFDMGVLFGVGTAVKLLQISMDNSVQIVTDGDFGEETLADVNQYGDIGRYRTVLLNHCMNIVNANPDLNVFVQGWVNRIRS